VATALATNQAQLTWKDNSSNESAFYLDRTTNGFNNVDQMVLNSNVTLYDDTNLASGVTYTYRVRAWNSKGYSAYSNTNSATTLALPVINQQPQSQAGVVGAAVSFSVTATGTPLPGYQWRFNGADMPGATAANLTLAGVQPTNAGSYAVVVSNSVGSVTSGVAVLTVLVPPALTAQPQGLTNAAGTIASFSASAAGTLPLAYQWQLNGLSLTNDGRITGATTNLLTITSVQAADAGNYTLVVTNAAGAATSAVAVLVVSGPPVITVQPTSHIVVAGDSVAFGVMAAGTLPLGYQWRKNGVNLSEGGNVLSATGASLTLANVQTNDAGSYQVVITNSLGSATSVVASLSVTLQPLSQNAGALVLVNSHSAKYLDFKHFVQPYLDNFGFPYTVLDITTNAPGASISNCAMIIIGHSQLDTNHAYLNAVVQASLSLAVSNGVGLVSFDNDLSTGSTPRYQFVQDIFGFSYGTSASGSGVSLPPTEPLSQMHYITARHPANDLVAFRASISLPGITVPAGATTLATVGSRPLVTVAKYGQGRAVQWGSYDWMVSTVLGPVDGLDDLVWRGVVWAARKPFVMRGLPNFVTMRVDDAYGPFAWVHAANAVGFKPFIALFYLLVTDASATDLQALTTSGKATTSIHSTEAYTSSFFYFNHATEQPWPDNVQSNNFYLGTQWHLKHGIPISKICATHYSEIGINCFAGLKAWGMEYVPIEIVPETIEYATPGAAWLVGGPYRLHETPQPGQVNWPTYYADWLTVPGHPEFDGQFFNIYPEVRDVAGCGEWCPDNDVPGSISRATQMAKRSLDSQVLTTIFSHELQYISQISSANWQAILQGITNNLASYNPIYVTLDYACQYVRATRTSRLLSSVFYPGSGQVTAVFSGKTDLDTQVSVFAGADSAITNRVVTVPAFSGSFTSTAAMFPAPPTILSAPTSQTLPAGATLVLSVAATGMEPLSYQWYQNTTHRLSDKVGLTGSAGNVLTLVNVLGADGGAYAVVVSNVVGVVTSTPPAVLTVIDPVITAQPVSRTNAAGSTAAFSVQAYGTAPAYQWYKNGQPVSGRTQAELVLTGVTDGNAGDYSVVVSNAYGNVGSSPATLTVWDPPVITAAPADGSNLAGTTVALSVQAVGTEPLNYQWYRDATNQLSDGAVVVGSTSNVVTLVNMLGADGGAYTVVVSNVAGVVTSTPPAVLTVIDPVITAEPVSRTNAAGSTAVFRVQAYGTPPEYQWYKNGQPVSSGTQAELVLPGVADGDAGDYSVVVSNAYGSVSSTTATLTVWDPPVITAVASDGTNVAGTTAVLTVQATGTEPMSYQWYRDVTNALSDGPATTGSASSVLSLVNVLGADGGAYTVVVSNVVGVVTSAPPAMILVVDPVITVLPLSQTNHAGSPAVFSVQADGTAPEYQWYKNGEPVAGGTQAELALARITDGDAGKYSVVVSNAYGSVSSSADLTVVSPLLIEQVTLGKDGVAITWNAVPGQNYLLQYKGSLEDTNWISVVPTVTAIAPSVLVTNPLANSTQRFYRVIQVP
jgi:hypothetical protein